MIFAQSRYENAELVFVTDSGDLQRKRVVEVPRYYGASFTARRHIAREGQRLEQLAALYFGDPELWWVIALANPELFYPEDLEAGTVVRIPNATPIL